MNQSINKDFLIYKADKDLTAVHVGDNFMETRFPNLLAANVAISDNGTNQ